jgi:hypothetical protein
VSAAHVNPVTVLAAVTKGFTTRGEIEGYFGIEPGDQFLRSALGDLEHHGHIEWNRKTGEVKAL